MTEANQNNIQQKMELNVTKLSTKSLVVKKSENTEHSNAIEIKADIFPDYLENCKFTKPDEFATEIENLKLSNDKNFLKIGKNLKHYLKTCCENDIKHPMFNKLLNMENVKLRTTQALKHLDVYDYCCYRFQHGQTTEKLLKLGIEKLYIITMLEDKTKQEMLEKFISDEKLSVDKTDKLVKLLNRKSDIFDLLDKFNKRCETDKPAET